MSDEVKAEEAAVDAYMDGVSEPSEMERVIYLRRRYVEVGFEYKTLLQIKEEATKTSNQMQLGQVRDGMMANYKARKYVVTELRKLGQKVEDKFITGG